MKKVLCEKNHYYDADRYDTCPHCACARAFLEKTAQQPQSGAPPLEAGTEAEAYWSMEQLRGRRAVQSEAAAYEGPAEAASDAPVMRTMAMLEPERIAEPFFPAEPTAEPLPAEPERTLPRTEIQEDRTDAPAPSDDGRTHVLYTDAQCGIEPVVGCLVCVKGAQQGASFPLIGGRNRIGRAADMDIVLSSDQEISRNTHCVITFDPASEAFYLQSGESRGLTYLNGELLLAPQPLKAHDLIRAGATTLLFMPLCGAQFHWRDYLGEDQQ